MALGNVANTDLEVSFSNTLGPPDLVYTGDVGLQPVHVVATESPTCNAVGLPICTTQIAISWVVGVQQCPHTSVTYNFVSGVSTILATATKTKADALPVLREGDASTCAGSWMLKVSPFTLALCTCDCEIATAGQSKVKAQ